MELLYHLHPFSVIVFGIVHYDAGIQECGLDGKMVGTFYFHGSCHFHGLQVSLTNVLYILILFPTY